MDYQDLAYELLKGLMKMTLRPGHKEMERFSSGETMLLVRLSEFDHMLPGDLAVMNKTTPAHIAKTLRSLELKGDIVREINKEDRRKIIVRITPQGLNRVMSVKQAMIQHFSDLLHQLGEHDAKEYVRIIQKITSFPHPPCFDSSSKG